MGAEWGVFLPKPASHLRRHACACHPAASVGGPPLMLSAHRTHGDTAALGAEGKQFNEFPVTTSYTRTDTLRLGPSTLIFITLIKTVPKFKSSTELILQKMATI